MKGLHQDGYSGAKRGTFTLNDRFQPEFFIRDRNITDQSPRTRNPGRGFTPGLIARWKYPGLVVLEEPAGRTPDQPAIQHTHPEFGWSKPTGLHQASADRTAALTRSPDPTNGPQKTAAHREPLTTFQKKPITDEGIPTRTRVKKGVPSPFRG